MLASSCGELCFQTPDQRATRHSSHHRNQWPERGRIPRNKHIQTAFESCLYQACLSNWPSPTANFTLPLSNLSLQSKANRESRSTQVKILSISRDELSTLLSNENLRSPIKFFKSLSTSQTSLTLQWLTVSTSLSTTRLSEGVTNQPGTSLPPWVRVPPTQQPSSKERLNPAEPQTFPCKASKHHKIHKDPSESPALQSETL